MDIKKTLLTALSSDEYTSGAQLARTLGVSRTAIWKAIESLRADGYEIDAVTNRGYRLMPTSDVISEDALRGFLGGEADNFSFEILASCTSTNTVIKEKASMLPEWHTVITGTQTDGRGRRGRSFYSPGGTGLYMSVLLRPKIPAQDSVLITTAAAVAVCRAAEDTTGAQPEIKWVNDVLLNGRKICGILTEANIDMESGALEYAVLGVGINVTEPEGGFPPELGSIAGALLPHRCQNMRCRLAAAFLRRFREIYERLPSRAFVAEYRAHSALIGRDILVLKHDGAVPANAVSVDDSCRLVVRYADGTEEALSSGEVSVRSAGSI